MRTPSLALILLASCQAASSLGFHTSPPSQPPPEARPQPIAPSQPDGAPPATVDDHGLITMPDVMHRNRGDAEAAIRATGLTGKIEVTLNGGASSIEVCRQIPSPGGKTGRNYSVTIELCAPERGPHVQPVLAGLSVEAATARAKAAGFSGRIEVHVLDEYAEGCKDDTVCRVTPTRWELDQDRVMELWINKKLAITAP